MGGSVLVLSIGLAWLLSLPEAAYEAIALSASLWVAYRGVVRYRQGDGAAKLDGLLIVGLALTVALSAAVFRRIDRDADDVLSLYISKLPYIVRPNTTNGQRMVNDAATLESYNNGLLTADCGGSIAFARAKGRPRTPVRAAAGRGLPALPIARMFVGRVTPCAPQMVLCRYCERRSF